MHKLNIPPIFWAINLEFDIDILGHVVNDILLDLPPKPHTASTHGEQKRWWILRGFLHATPDGGCVPSRSLVRVVPIYGPFSFKPLSNPNHIKHSCYSGPTMLHFLPGRPYTHSQLPNP